MNKRRVMIAQVLLLLIVIGGTVYVADSVVQGNLFSHPYEVQVELKQASGLHERSDVTYRGTSVGRVAKMDITPGGVVAKLQLHPGVKIPTDTLAVVANLSAVGEQYLDFRPRSAGGPYLKDGSKIGTSQTRLPLAPSKMISDALNLSKKLDVNDITTISNELSTAFGDPRVNMLEISQEAEQLFTTLEQMQPQTISLLTNGQKPLRTMADWGGGMTEFAKNIDAVTATMKASDGDVRGLLHQGGIALPELNALLKETKEPIGRLLTASLVPAQVYYDRQPALNAFLNWGPLQMVAMATSTEGGAGAVTVVTNAGPNCQYAVKQKNPTDTRRTAAPRNAQCTRVHPYVQQRGSVNAPRPR
jgi:phospholipid/cholesterol/gamma-HCH transport system substrate-binding protein